MMHRIFLRGHRWAKQRLDLVSDLTVHNVIDWRKPVRKEGEEGSSLIGFENSPFVRNNTLLISRGIATRPLVSP